MAEITEQLVIQACEQICDASHRDNKKMSNLWGNVDVLLARDLVVPKSEKPVYHVSTHWSLLGRIMLQMM